MLRRSIKITDYAYKIGQLTLADFLPIDKPTSDVESFRINCKVYCPSYFLQGSTESLTMSDMGDWSNIRQNMIDEFLEAFHWKGRYTDNALNRRLKRVGKLISYPALESKIEVVNDEQMSNIEQSLSVVSEERGNEILRQALSISDTVDDLEKNVRDLLGYEEWRKFAPYSFTSRECVDLYNDSVTIFNRINMLSPEEAKTREAELKSEISSKAREIQDVLERSRHTWVYDKPIDIIDVSRAKHHKTYIISEDTTVETGLSNSVFVLEDALKILEEKVRR